MQNNTPAGFFVRLFAYLIDIVLMGTGFFFVKAFSVFSPLSLLSRNVFFSFTLIDILAFIFTSTYFVLLTYFNGQTIGKMMFGIQVVNKDGEKLSVFDCIVREVFGRYLSSMIMNIGYLIIGPDKEKQSLSDRICDTRVIYKR